jgi:hypothetical protein
VPYELFGTLIVGALSALFLWLFYRAVLRRPLPRRLLPIGVGLAMIAYTVWSEYSWGWRTREALPEGIEVIETFATNSLWRPWTFIAPQVTRMIAVDRAGIRHNPAYPGIALVDLVLLERFAPARRIVRLIDCGEARTADVTDPSRLSEGGLPAPEAWVPLRRDAMLYRALCPAER